MANNNTPKKIAVVIFVLPIVILFHLFLLFCARKGYVVE